jgi:hypothetical protein
MPVYVRVCTRVYDLAYAASVFVPVSVRVSLACATLHMQLPLFDACICAGQHLRVLATMTLHMQLPLRDACLYLCGSALACTRVYDLAHTASAF